MSPRLPSSRLLSNTCWSVKEILCHHFSFSRESEFEQMFSSPLDKITRGLLRHLSRRCPGFSSEPFLQTLPPSHTSPIALGVCRTSYWCKENSRLWNEGKKITMGVQYNTTNYSKSFCVSTTGCAFPCLGAFL